jgi:hypothetical protein
VTDMSGPIGRSPVRTVTRHLELARRITGVLQACLRDVPEPPSTAVATSSNL